MDRNTLNTLIGKLQDDTITDAEKEELMDHYNSFQFQRQWDESTMGNAAEVKKRIFRNIPDHTRGKIVRFAPLYRVAAACALLVAMAWIGYTYFYTPGASMITVQSGKDTKEVVLPDGSKVTMNINSTLTYPVSFTSSRRDVTFEGEGFFEVQANSDYPFVVSTSAMKVKVLGTAFNLKAYEEDPIVETSLLHGHVEIWTNDEKQTLSTLKPNQKFVMEKAAADQPALFADVKSNIEIVPVEFISAQDTAPVDVAWKDGKFAFASATLSDVAREMKRRYEVHITFRNEETAQYRYTASFESETVVEILDALKLVKPFDYRKEGNDIIIY